MSLQKTLEDNRQAYVDELVDFLRIPAVSARSEHKGDMMECAEWLKWKYERLTGVPRRCYLGIEGNTSQ